MPHGHGPWGMVIIQISDYIKLFRFAYFILLRQPLWMMCYLSLPLTLHPCMEGSGWKYFLFPETPRP